MNDISGLNNKNNTGEYSNLFETQKPSGIEITGEQFSGQNNEVELEGALNKNNKKTDTFDEMTLVEDIMYTTIEALITTLAILPMGTNTILSRFVGKFNGLKELSIKKYSRWVKGVWAIPSGNDMNLRIIRLEGTKMQLVKSTASSVLTTDIPMIPGFESGGASYLWESINAQNVGYIQEEVISQFRRLSNSNRDSLDWEEWFKNIRSKCHIKSGSRESKLLNKLASMTNSHEINLNFKDAIMYGQIYDCYSRLGLLNTEIIK